MTMRHLVCHRVNGTLSIRAISWTASTEALVYEVGMPIDRKTDHLSDAILQLDPNNLTAVEWDESKEKK